MGKLWISGRRCAVAACAIALASSFAVAPDSAAQGMPGGGMGGKHGGGRGQSDQHNAPHPPDAGNRDAAPNPLTALLPAMRSLRTDILLKTEQVEAWGSMEQSLRHCVEVWHDRPRGPASSNGDASEPPVDYVRNLAEDEHTYSDALADFALKMQAVVGSLDERQLKLFNDRLATALASTTPRSSY